MTEAEVIDRINSTIKKNGKNAITGEEMNFVLKAIIQLISDSGGVVNWGDIEGTIADQLDLASALNGKVDTVAGKGLSTNDFTNTLKTKLDAIEAGAEVNVKADWTATSGDAEILNKPTIPTGITVGTTPSTGTDDGVFFQAGGVVQQDSAFFWDNTNKRLGVGANPSTSVRLDVRAQGALSTNIAFRVRNSANNTDLFSVQGNAITNFGGGTVGGSQLQIICGGYPFATNLTLQFASSRSISCVNGGLVETGIRINHNSNTRIAGLMIGSSTGTQVYIDGGQNIRIGQGYSTTNQPDANATRTIQQMTGVAPTTSVAGGYQLYSAGVVAGNAAPHFRTEVGDIIKLYKQSSAGITTVADLVTVLTNLGLLG